MSLMTRTGRDEFQINHQRLAESIEFTVIQLWYLPIIFPVTIAQSYKQNK